VTAGIIGWAAGRPNQLPDRHPVAMAASVVTIISARIVLIIPVSYQEWVGRRAQAANRTTLHQFLRAAS
jgi:hypothetical protein